MTSYRSNAAEANRSPKPSCLSKTLPPYHKIFSCVYLLLSCHERYTMCSRTPLDPRFYLHDRIIQRLIHDHLDHMMSLFLLPTEYFMRKKAHQGRFEWRLYKLSWKRRKYSHNAPRLTGCEPNSNSCGRKVRQKLLSLSENLV